MRRAYPRPSSSPLWALRCRVDPVLETSGVTSPASAKQRILRAAIPIIASARGGARRRVRKPEVSSVHKDVLSRCGGVEMQRCVCVVTAAALFIASSSAAQLRARDASRERRIEEALTAMAPTAVPDFRRATQAMDSGKPAEAEALFREVLAAAPTFTPAMRRLGGVLVEVDREGDGLALLK